MGLGNAIHEAKQEVADVDTTHGNNVLAVTFSRAGATEMNERLKKLVKGIKAGTVTGETLLASLNPEQREVVLHKDGPLLVVAVAGSGKTHALVSRVAYMIAEHGLSDDSRIGTFHSLALQILKTEAGESWDWEVDGKNTYRTYILKDTVGYKELNWKTSDVTILESFIGFCKANLARPESERAMEIANEYWSRYNGKPGANPNMLLKAYFRAEEIRCERRLLTFDDMLMDCVELLQEDESARRRWASKWNYVMQDEAQDQNLGQLLMGELLAKDHGNYALIGDPAQTIFTFRGAQPDKLLGFEAKFDAKVITMGRNYRCGQVIIDAANKSLDAMDPASRLDVKMICERGVEGEVTSESFETLDDEGAMIARRIEMLMADGVEPRDVAVLYRTNAQSRAPEESLIGARIPYRIIGGVNFYERREVKSLLAYLRLAARRGRLDDMNRCINAPFRFLGRAYVDKAKEAAKIVKRRTSNGGGFTWTEVVEEANEMAHVHGRQKESALGWAMMIEEMASLIERQTAAMATEGFDAYTERNRERSPYTQGMPARILEDIIRRTRYAQWLTKDEGEESTENSRVSNIRELVRAAERFPTVAELLDYIDITVKKSKKNKGERNPNKVTLCSLHRSKGLEWPAVFVIGCSEGILPHARAEEPEEERRLFYVGVTRAKDVLSLSAVRTAAMGGQIRAMAPSSFLSEVGLSPRRVPHPDDIGSPDDV